MIRYSLCAWRMPDVDTFRNVDGNAEIQVLMLDTERITIKVTAYATS